MISILHRGYRLLRSRGGMGLLLRGSGVAILTSLAGMVASYGANIYLARLLGSSELGVYALILSWATLLLIPAGLGQHVALLRLLPVYAVEERWDMYRGLLRQSWWITVGSGLLLGAIAAGIGRFFSVGLGLALGFALVPLLGLMNVQSAMLRVQHRIFLALAPNNLLRFLLLIALMFLLVVWLDVPATGATALLALATSLLLLIVIQQGALRRGWSDRVFAQAPRYRTREWLAISLPMLLTTSSLVLLKRSDIVMLGMFTSSADVGVYFVASRVAALTAFAMTAVNTIAGPLISAAHAEGDRPGLQRLATGIVQLAFWPSLLVSFVLIGFGEPILRLFGPDFGAGRWPLTLLVIGYLMNVGAGAVSTLLNMSGHQNNAARVFGVAVVVNIALNLLAIPRYGTVGAAAATALTMAGWNLWLSALVYRRLGLRTSVLGPILRRFGRRE